MSLNKLLLKQLKRLALIVSLLHIIFFVDEAIVARFLVKNTCRPTGLLIDTDYEDCHQYRGPSFYINKFFCEIKPNQYYGTVPLHKGYYCLSIESSLLLTPDEHYHKPVNPIAPLLEKGSEVFSDVVDLIYQLVIINPLVGIVFGVWLLFYSKKAEDKKLRYFGLAVAIILIITELIMSGPWAFFWLKSLCFSLRRQ